MSQPSATNVKIIKKGETIFKEGDRASSIYAIQAGSVSLSLARAKAPVELFVAGQGQMIGEFALAGILTNPYSAIATTEVRIVELPADSLRAALENLSPTLKTFIKTLNERNKMFQGEIKSLRLERESMPCTPEGLAHVFASIWHTGSRKGEKQKDGTIKVSWGLLRQYSQRMFGESLKRLENAMNVFVKLGYAKYIMGKPPEQPDGPDEILEVVFNNLNVAENVAEFWAYHHFRGGRGEILKTDEKTMQVVAAMLAYIKVPGFPHQGPDQRGFVRVEFAPLVEKYKQESGVTLSADYFNVMEARGVFIKRIPGESKVELQFDIRELEQSLSVWGVLKEVEKWNEKGSVDITEAPFNPRVFARSDATQSCPACSAPLQGAPKFCPECGHKIAAAA